MSNRWQNDRFNHPGEVNDFIELRIYFRSSTHSRAQSYADETPPPGLSTPPAAFALRDYGVPCPPPNRNLPPIRRKYARDQPQQRRLPAPVAPNQPEALAALEVEGDVAEGPEFRWPQIRL